MRIFKKLLLLNTLLFILFLFGCNNDAINNIEDYSVRGRIVNYSQFTFSRSRVIINGTETFVNNDGSFALENIESTPFDVHILSDTYQNEIHEDIFKSVTLRDLNIKLPYFTYPQRYRYTANVKLPFILDSDKRIRFYLREKNNAPPSSIDWMQTDSITYNVKIKWDDNPSLLSDLIILYDSHLNGSTITFDGFYVFGDVPMSDQMDTTSIIPASGIIDPGEISYTGSIITPPGATDPGKGFFFTFKEKGIFIEQSGYSPSYSGNSYSLKLPTGIPIIPRVLYRAGVGVGLGTISTVQQLYPGNPINLNGGPMESFPPDNYSQVTSSTIFEWERGVESGIYLFTSYEHGSFVRIFTSLNNIDFSGIINKNFLDSKYRYYWQLLMYKGYNGIDEFLNDPYNLNCKGTISSPGRTFYIDNKVY